MKKASTFVGLALLLSAVAVVSPLTTATGAQGGQTLKYSAIFRDSQFTDVDSDDSGGESAGDTFVGNFILRHGGKARGHLEFHCFIVTISPNRDLCHGVVHINGSGEFAVADVSPHDSESSKVMITGGTGEFGSAGGNGKVDFGRNRAHFVFKIK